MTYFSDLSPCTYFGRRHPALLAVGWLQRDQQYPVGDPGPQVYERLKEYRKGSWQPSVFFGGHTCDLCMYDGFYSHTNIFVPGHGVTYVAPEGIVHYVGCHHYLPPFEFSEALLNSPSAGSPEYFARLHANGWSPTVACPTEEDPKWQRRFQVEAVLKARGEAIVAAIEAFRETHGALPAEIAHAVDVVQDVPWEFRVEGSEYRLTAHSKVEGVRVSRTPGLSRWSCSYDAA
jgi:hypothetical protein